MHLLRKSIDTQAGFTIVELLVSLIVGAILVGSVNTIYTNQLFLSQRTRDTVIANAFVEAKVEALRSRGYLGVSLGSTDITGEMPAELNLPRNATLAVTTHSTSVKQIQLTLTFNEQGVAQNYSYITYLGELGVGQ